MNIKPFYLLLAIIGAIVPYIPFVLFLMTNGLNIILLLEQLLANYISTFFALDVIISAIVLLIFIYHEREKVESKLLLVLPIIGTFVIGVSFGLPLFLYLREP